MTRRHEAKKSSRDRKGGCNRNSPGNVSGPKEISPAYLLWRRRMIRDNPLKPASAITVGSGVGVVGV